MIVHRSIALYGSLFQEALSESCNINMSQSATRSNVSTNVSAGTLDSTHQLDYTCECVWLCDKPGTYMMVPVLRSGMNEMLYAGPVYPMAFRYCYTLVYTYKLAYDIMTAMSLFILPLLHSLSFSKWKDGLFIPFFWFYNTTYKPCLGMGHLFHQVHFLILRPYLAPVIHLVNILEKVTTCMTKTCT